MDLFTSIKICFKKYLDFTGRAPWLEFWYFAFFTLLIGFCFVILDAAIFGTSYLNYGPTYIIFSILVFFPSIAVLCRRLHDINKSGWWMLISITIIGIVPLIYWLCLPGDEIENKYGNLHEDKKNTFDEKTRRKWTNYFIVPITIILVFLFLLELFMVKTYVQKGSQLSQGNKVELINNKIISKNDNILFFYSAGLFSILDDGQLITTDKIVVYQKNEEQLLEIYEMHLNNVKDIVLEEEGSFFSDSIYKIIGDKNAKYEYIRITLSTEGNKHKDFLNLIYKKIN